MDKSLFEIQLICRIKINKIAKKIIFILKGNQL